MKRIAWLTLVLAAGTAAFAEDSPLVQSAKRAVEARKKASAKPSVVINEETLAKTTGVLSTSKGGADVPRYVPSNTPAPMPAPQPTAQQRRPNGATSMDAYTVQAATDPRLPRPVAYSSTAPAASQNAGGYRPPNQ